MGFWAEARRLEMHRFNHLRPDFAALLAENHWLGHISLYGLRIFLCVVCPLTAETRIYNSIAPKYLWDDGCDCLVAALCRVLVASVGKGQCSVGITDKLSQGV